MRGARGAVVWSRAAVLHRAPASQPKQSRTPRLRPGAVVWRWVSSSKVGPPGSGPGLSYGAGSSSSKVGPPGSGSGLSYGAGYRSKSQLWAQARISIAGLALQSLLQARFVPEVAAGYVNSGSARPPRPSQTPSPCPKQSKPNPAGWQLWPGSGLGTEAPLAPRGQWAPFFGVCGLAGPWLPLYQILGGSALAGIRPRALTGDRNPPLEGPTLPSTVVERPECQAVDRPLGNSVGAIEWPGWWKPASAQASPPGRVHLACSPTS